MLCTKRKSLPGNKPQLCNRKLWDHQVCKFYYWWKEFDKWLCSQGFITIYQWLGACLGRRLNLRRGHGCSEYLPRIQGKQKSWLSIKAAQALGWHMKGATIRNNDRSSTNWFPICENSVFFSYLIWKKYITHSKKPFIIDRMQLVVESIYI